MLFLLQGCAVTEGYDAEFYPWNCLIDRLADGMQQSKSRIANTCAPAFINRLN